MMSHAWPIVLRGGLLSPRGYPPLYALMILSHRVLRYASPLLHVAVAGATLALLRGGPAYRAAALAQAGLLGAAAAGGRVAGAAVAARPLLRRHDRRARRRPLRPPPPRHAGRVGGAGGHAVSYRGKRALDVVVAGGALVLAAPVLARRGGADPAGDARAPDLPAAPRRAARRAVRPLQAAHDGQRRRDDGRRAGRRRGRLADHPARRGAAPHVDGRAAEPRQRAARGDVGRRPAPDGAGAGRPLHRAPARPPRRPAGPDRAGRRSTVAHRCRGTSGSSSTSGTSSTPRSRLDLRILWRTLRMVLGGHGLYRGETGGWRER